MTSSAIQTAVMGMDVKRGPTPEQLAVIEKVAEGFHKDWVMDVKTRQIRRKDRSWFRAVRDLVYPQRHSVFAMYWWLKRLYGGKFAEEDRSKYMPFALPLIHDNMPIVGYPMKYELVGEWTIPKRDLRYLSHGPLARKDDGAILVSHEIGWERWKSTAKAFWFPISVILGLMGIILTVTGFLELIGV